MSTRKKRKGVEERDKLYKLLECPICLDTMGPPIFQCREGHLICSPCREKIDKCPTCRIPLDNIRNRALENMVAKMVMPCPNRIYGCTMTPRFEDMARHQEVCQYRMYHCPRSRSSCTWQGPLSQVANHLKEKHNMAFSYDDHGLIDETYSNPEGVKTAVWEGPMMTCSSEVFLMHFEQLPSREYVAFVRFFGNEEGASRFRYRMTIEHGGRSLTWKGVPRSIRDTVKEVVSSNDCMIIKENLAYYFSDNSSTGQGTEKSLRLSIKGEIWMESEPRSNVKRMSSGCSKAIQPPEV
eukprot:g5758.t1